MESKRLYERAFFVAFQEQVRSLPRNAPSHMRKEALEQAHLYATEATMHFSRLKELQEKAKKETVNE